MNGVTHAAIAFSRVPGSSQSSVPGSCCYLFSSCLSIQAPLACLPLEKRRGRAPTLGRPQWFSELGVGVGLGWFRAGGWPRAWSCQRRPLGTGEQGRKPEPRSDPARWAEQTSCGGRPPPGPHGPGGAGPGTAAIGAGTPGLGRQSRRRGRMRAPPGGAPRHRPGSLPLVLSRLGGVFAEEIPLREGCRGLRRAVSGSGRFPGLQNWE